MLYQWAKVPLLAGVLCGLCPSAQANTTTDAAAPDVALARIALLLPLRSPALGQAAQVVRAGFLAAHEREGQSVSVTVVGTGDAPEEAVSVYWTASARHDIIVGPLSRSGVAAIAQSGAVYKPTVALTAPDTPENAGIRLPPRLLVMSLSIEDEARQVADWAARDHALSKAYVVHTQSPWQRRAVAAFAERWQRLGLDMEAIELDASEGYLDWKTVIQLRTQLRADPSPLLFAALDAWQARQLRESIGNGVPFYGTSQLNPVALPDQVAAEPIVEMEGAHLLDIPWQLQADHPAVMAYPRLAVEADQKRSADMERLYALGIDAYRVARAIALRSTDFELDGVTGKLTVRFDEAKAHFERTAQPAVYRNGGVVAVDSAR